VPLSVIFDREGECLELSTVREGFEEDSVDVSQNEMKPSSQHTGSEGKVNQMVLDIADMISEINQGDE
jgi:hypothetical protein